MRRWGWIAVGALAAALGCGHEQAGSNGAPASSAWEGAKESFASAYESVKSGTQRTAAAGKYALKDAGQGVVQVTDKSKRALEHAGGSADDVWITTKVKAELAATKGVRSGAIDARTDNGVVTLSGTVDSPRTAELAIDRTLGVKGVVAVDSSLQYPTRRRPSQLYTPEDRPSGGER
jgi:hyperosmotically inducible protein